MKPLLLLSRGSDDADFLYACRLAVEEALYLRFQPGDDLLVVSGLELDRARREGRAARVVDRREVGWAEQRAKDLGVNGVYLLICKEPGRVEVFVDEQTRKKAFPLGERDKLVKKMLEQFRDKKFDAGLLEGIDFIGSSLKANLGK